MIKKLPYYLFAVLVFILYSCASSIPHSDAMHEEWAEKQWNITNLEQCRKIYVANCTGCHTLHSPGEHFQKEWRILFNEMAGKAHMTPADSVSVLAYLETYSKDNKLE